VPVVRDWEQKFIAFVCGTGLNRQEIEALTQYESDLLYDYLISKSLNQILHQIKMFSEPQPIEPKERITDLAGGKKIKAISGMQSTQDILNAVNMLEGQIKTDG
jgi:hypothetical protein